MSQYKGFTTVQLRKPKRSMFDLSHEKRLSTRMGRLTPIFISEALPNDTFTVSSEVMLRLAPLLAPIMHRVNVFVHFFFVPNRILWKDWEKFITGGRLGEAVDTPPVPPFFYSSDITSLGQNALDKHSLWDYFGGKPAADTYNGAFPINALPFLAYQKIWLDYYRDRNLVGGTNRPNDDTFPVASGEVGASTGFNRIFVVTNRLRAWQHDYFTSALPWTQRGAEVLMPLEGTGTVTYKPATEVRQQDGGVPAINSNYRQGSSIFAQEQTGGENIRFENIDQVLVDASSVSINDLRRAVRLQEWLERNALAGSRYNESIMAHFARKTSDGRLQRAEYLGGGKVPVQISEVLTTAYSEDSSPTVVPPANMAGHGISVGKSNRFKYNCEEHGFVIGIMSVMPVTSYMQGIPRMFLKRNSFLDYPWPSFAHLGEQEVYKWELWNGDAAFNDTNIEGNDVFGYQSRYADWKQIPSSSHGDFRDSLDFWHLSRKFSSNPSLNEQFVSFDDNVQDRIFAVEGVNPLWCYIYNNVKVVRSLPYFGTPML